TTNLKGEVTNYCRYNGGRVRQNTHVNQYFFSFRLIKGARHLKLSFSLGEDPKLAREKLNERWLHAKSQIEKLPEDPHPPLIQNNGKRDHHDSGQLPNDDALLIEVPRMVEAHDFCGLAASGLQVSANQNSLGQKHWFSRESFFLDYSLY